MAPLCPQAVCAPQQESEQETFLRTLLHDDRNSFYVLSTDEGGRWEDVPVRRAQLAALPLGMGAGATSASYYITHNGFADRRRKLESCRQVNAMFFDLDCHGAAGFECRRLVGEANRLVGAAVEAGALPRPTMVVDSGRGLHLYYVLERSIPCRLKAGGSMQPNEKTLAYFHDVQLRLADVLDGVLGGLGGVDVDRAVFDCTRVSRIPGTYNAKAGRRARLLSADGGYWQLGDLARYRAHAAVSPSPAALPAAQPQHTPAGTLVRFDRLMASRLRKVAELQEHRGYACEGNRELMCFVYYNTAVQLYERAEAFRRLGAFNARFKKPLGCDELEGVRSAVDGVVNVKGERGHYVLSAETLIRLLALTPAEIEATRFFTSKRAAERAEAKRITRARRDERDQRICNLYATGELTQAQVAEAIGCSVRTVSKAVKAAGMARPYTRKSAAQDANTMTIAAPEASAASRPRRTALATQQRRQQQLAAFRQALDARARYTAGLSTHIKSAQSWHPCLGGSAGGAFEGSVAPVLRPASSLFLGLRTFLRWPSRAAGLLGSESQTPCSGRRCPLLPGPSSAPSLPPWHGQPLASRSWCPPFRASCS